jgi:hypothetical protein
VLQAKEKDLMLEEGTPDTLRVKLVGKRDKFDFTFEKRRQCGVSV